MMNFIWACVGIGLFIALLPILIPLGAGLVLLAFRTLPLLLMTGFLFYLAISMPGVVIVLVCLAIVLLAVFLIVTWLDKIL